ncbi:MAG: tetratricopeptide repeat protein [Methylococcales bacterium]
MKKTTFVALLLLFSSQCFAETLNESLKNIESEWASIYYTFAKDEQGPAYTRLLEKTEQLVQKFPNKAEPVIWQAVVKATYADHQDAISALDAINEARDLLVKAIAMNPKAMSGSAYVTLGTLYYMVPKWPIGFGDTEEAKKLLETALKINPNGIDANYFYGEFLLSTNQLSEAVKYFERAAVAPTGPEQSLADIKLKEEAKMAIKNVKQRKISGAKSVFLSLFNSASAK